MNTSLHVHVYTCIVHVVTVVYMYRGVYTWLAGRCMCVCACYGARCATMQGACAPSCRHERELCQSLALTLNITSAKFPTTMNCTTLCKICIVYYTDM